MNAEDYRKKIELEILAIIEQKLINKQMSADRAKEIARFVLNSLHPHMDINKIYSTVQNFDKNFPELIPIVIKVSQDYENQIKQIVAEHASFLLKQNKVNEASDLLKKALNKELRL